MIVGILADTHGRAARASRALELLLAHHAAAIIHCGDVGESVFEILAAALAADGVESVRFVWGNTDHRSPALERYVRELGLAPPPPPPLRIELDGKRFLVLHGHEPQLDDVRDGDCDYLLHGHTHVRRDERIGSIRVINPGALHRAARYSVATLDTQRDELAFHDLP
ncbi:MAG: hypothetical protein CHACPFDD_02690 [Phycisphaerae bacterium]|nr:hypothetical protein [Phycisphaerae bacterium]